MPKIDLSKVPVCSGSSYPAPYAAQMGDRAWQELGDAGGLTQFGVSMMIMPPGSKSSMRHWHTGEDEFVMVTQGALILVQDAGETPVKPGDCVAFPAGDPNGHHFINRSNAEARFLVIGTRIETDTCVYSDVDMKLELRNGKGEFTRKDGSALSVPSTEETK
ncbi:MAG: cupin domain-containing protein [Paracoccaceae bacterium]